METNSSKLVASGSFLFLILSLAFSLRVLSELSELLATAQKFVTSIYRVVIARIYFDDSVRLVFVSLVPMVSFSFQAKAVFFSHEELPSLLNQEVSGLLQTTP
jgi:hypothetical protein